MKIEGVPFISGRVGIYSEFRFSSSLFERIESDDGAIDPLSPLTSAGAAQALLEPRYSVLKLGNESFAQEDKREESDPLRQLTERTLPDRLPQLKPHRHYDVAARPPALGRPYLELCLRALSGLKLRPHQFATELVLHSHQLFRFCVSAGNLKQG